MPIFDAFSLSPVKVLSDKVEDSSPISAQSSGEKPRSRYIPAQIRREVWVRAGGRCGYVSPENGRRCAEKKGLEVEHINPFARGGTHDLFNLDLFCRSHNLHAAVKTFGSRMDRYAPPQ